MILNGRIGSVNRIPFPIAIRASLGYYLSLFAIVSRAVIACVPLSLPPPLYRVRADRPHRQQHVLVSKISSTLYQGDEELVRKRRVSRRRFRARGLRWLPPTCR